MTDFVKVEWSVHNDCEEPSFQGDQPDLRLPEIGVGSHGTVWDLKPWLHKGGAGIQRKLVAKHIKQGLLGEALPERLELVEKLHERFKTLLVLGRGHHYVKVLLNCTAKFIAWTDEYTSVPLRLETAEQAFLEWAESLWLRANIKRDIKKYVAYGQAAKVAGILSYILEVKVDNRASTYSPLMRKTRLKRSRGGSRKADKSNLADAATFGRCLVDLCEAFTSEAIRGPLPFVLRLPNGVERHWPSHMLRSLEGFSNRNMAAALRLRQALQPHQHVTDNHHRAAMANLRIEAELAIFVAQTGMNSQQALRLKCKKVRWKYDGGDVLAFKVYKGRRKGEALFRAFREYRQWLSVYLAWRDEIAPHDERLFPFFNNAIAPPEDKRRWSFALKQLCQNAEVPYFNLRDIRNLRQNWLLRVTGNADLTATMGAHAKQTLLRDYEKPHHQLATSRISQFHQKFDPSPAAGPGLCADPDHSPTPEPHIPSSAPKPDCVSPEGCLFCVHHRDIRDLDYAWKLASHAHLKGLERDDYERPMKSETEPHPADVIIDRIEDKLSALAGYNKDCAVWVEEAKSRVWEGRYHPAWEGFIELWELLK